MIQLLFGVATFVENRAAKTLGGVSTFTATTPISQATPLNGETLGYRIGDSDRNPGEVSQESEGFAVLNQTNENVFQTINGKWCALGPIGNLDFLDPNLLPSWRNNIPSGPPGYRVGCFGPDESNYSGTVDGYPNGFLILNQSTGHVFEVQGGTLETGDWLNGVWTQNVSGSTTAWIGGTWASSTFPAGLLNAWLENEGVTYVKSNYIASTGTARIG
jgi:hypothetical protein